jgi:hypothetical protein
MDLSGAVGLDEQSPNLPDESSPLPQPRSRGLFFSQTQDPEETEEPLPAAGEGDAGGSASADPWSEPSDGLNDSEHDSWTASPAGDAKPAALLSKAQMRATARTAVTVSTGMAHTVAAKTPAQKQLGLYLADDEDARAIGDPLADIAHRRGDIVGGKLSPDANDLLRSMMGVAGYFAKQVAKIGEVRRIEAGAAAAEVQHFPTGEVA